MSLSFRSRVAGQKSLVLGPRTFATLPHHHFAHTVSYPPVWRICMLHMQTDARIMSAAKGSGCTNWAGISFGKFPFSNQIHLQLLVERGRAALAGLAAQLLKRKARRRDRCHGGDRLEQQALPPRL